MLINFTGVLNQDAGFSSAVDKTQYKDFLVHIFQSITFIRTLAPLEESLIKAREVLMPPLEPN